MATVDQVIPLWNEIVNGTSRTTNAMRHWRIRLTEWDPAVHAASTLRSQALFIVFGINLLKVEHACSRIPVGRDLAVEFFESGWLTHFCMQSPTLL